MFVIACVLHWFGGYVNLYLPSEVDLGAYKPQDGV